MNLRVALVVAVMSAEACSSTATPTSPTTTPSASSPAGSWSGSISDAVAGDGTMALALSEGAPNSLTGTWSATFKNGDSFSGPAGASLVSSTSYGISLYVNPQPPCTASGGSALLGYTLINVVVTTNRLTAVAGRTSCNGASFGSVSLSKP